MLWDQLLIDATLVSPSQQTGYVHIEHTAIGWHNGVVCFIGKMTDLADAPERLAQKVESVGNALVTPGLIDCHSHAIFAGNRIGEFEQRLVGASYQDIAAAGGGIISSVRATRGASQQQLLTEARPRIQQLIASGVTTLEIKSGYALEPAGELRMLRVARQIASELGICVRTTFLGAHAVPPEFIGNVDQYLDLVCDTMLPALLEEELVDAVDVFCESVGFSAVQTRRVFEAAAALGIPVKLHADQLSNTHGAALAAEYSALSADHLEYTDEAGVIAMAKAGTVAVMLPASFHFLRERQLPPIELFRKHGVPMAVASDLNPGTSPVASLTASMNLACTLFRMTPEECFRGVTQHAAKAIGLPQKGKLEVGSDADLVVWPAQHAAELSYWIQGLRARQVFAQGKLIFSEH